MIVQRRGPAYRFQAQGTRWELSEPWRANFLPMAGLAVMIAGGVFALALLFLAMGAV